MDLPTFPFSLSFFIFVHLSFGAASEKPKSSRPPCGGSSNFSRRDRIGRTPHTSVTVWLLGLFFSFFMLRSHRSTSGHRGTVYIVTSRFPPPLGL